MLAFQIVIAMHCTLSYMIYSELSLCGMEKSMSVFLLLPAHRYLVSLTPEKRHRNFFLFLRIPHMSTMKYNYIYPLLLPYNSLHIPSSMIDPSQIHVWFLDTLLTPVSTAHFYTNV